ncbi:MAG: hypothetical protein LBS10_08135, partial [Gracilibacteraceae bacterium]|nr:hypothetical protein [Gracilibacteraceae bacterium]
MRRPRFLQKNKSIESIIHCLEEKYGDTFTYYNSDTQSFMSKYQEIWLRAVKLPKKMVQVLRDKYTGDLTDNYLGLLLKDDIQALLQRTAAQVFEGCLLFYTPGMAYTPLEGDTDARGFLRSPG